MAKVIFHPSMQAYSGRMGNQIYSYQQGLKPIQDVEVKCIVRSYNGSWYDPLNVPYRLYNINRAFKIVADKWAIVKGNFNALGSWEEAKKQICSELGYKMSTYNLFIGYYMSKYNVDLGSYILPTDISNFNAFYENRSNGIWI